MNVKTLITQASVLDDEMAWSLIEPELEKGYDAKLWHFATKVATRLNNYQFLSDFYKNVLIADPINPTISFKLLDSLLKAEYYNDFIEHLQEVQKNNILSTELIEKIYARFAGQICKNFENFSDETILLLLDNIVNLKKTYNTDFTKKIFNNFIKNILSKDFNDKKNLIFLEKAVDLSDFVHSKILINITANFIKQNNYVFAYSLLHRIFITDPFNAKGFMYAIALYEKDVLYSPLIIQWLDYLENEPKTKEHEILNYALCLMYKQDFIKADSVFEKALENFNESEDIIFHYAENLFFLDRFEEAKIFIDANQHKIINLKTKLFQLKAQIALAVYDVHALENILDNAEENNLSSAYIIKILLSLQRNEDAYKIYQDFNIIKELYNIFSNKKFPFDVFEKNNKKPIKAKMLVLNCILGLGDEVRFSCFFPMLSKICTNVKIVCDSRLYNLRKHQFPKISFIPIDKVNPCFNSNPIKNVLFYRDFNNKIYDFAQEADYVVTFTQLLEPLLKLEKNFSENNKAQNFLTFFKNYFLKNLDKSNTQQSLKPKSDIQNHWKNWLDTLPKKPKIGLFWRADISQLSYYHKKSNLKEWIELLNDLQIVIIPLQYGLSATEISLMHQYPDLFFTPPNLDLKNDIEGLSGLISGLDYVVTTAGTTQHIAGALNKTVLACVHPYEVYWRCNADATKDRFAPNVHILFSKPSEGIKGSMNVTVKKLKEMLTYE